MGNQLSQFSTTTQFYLYGKKHCTRNGWLAAQANYKQPDILSNNYVDLSLNNKIYMITGANSGIGYEITKYLAFKHATVYMLCRNKERGEKVLNELKEITNNNNLYLIICNCGVEMDIRRAYIEFCTIQNSKTITNNTNSNMILILSYWMV